MKKRAIIIDDEHAAIEVLSYLIKSYCNEIKLVASADSVEKGIELIESYNPDIIFLDIEMPDGSGFELVEKTKKLPYKVIFTTAYENYALRAIKNNATDYLLKPVDIEELKSAVAKALKSLENNVDNTYFSKPVVKNNPNKISIPTSEGYTLLDTLLITRVEADSSYSHIHTSDRKSIIVSKSLKEIQEMLDDMFFIRIHNSHIININFIDKYLKSDGGGILMKDGSFIPVSRHKKQEVIKLFT